MGLFAGPSGMRQNMACRSMPNAGGAMYLGESLTVGDKHYPMVGFLPIAFGMEKRPQGHGYTLLNVERENPFFPVGTGLKGHEFHYSRILSWRGG